MVYQKFQVCRVKVEKSFKQILLIEIGKKNLYLNQKLNYELVNINQKDSECNNTQLHITYDLNLYACNLTIYIIHLGIL